MMYSEELKKYITALLNFSRHETWHGEYELNVKWSNVADPEDRDSTCTKMRVKIDCVYLQVTVTVYPDIINDWDDKKYKALGKYALHEFCHLFLEPIIRLFWWDVPTSQKPNTQDHIERQTERIASALFFHLPADWYIPENLVKAGYLDAANQEPPRTN